MGREGSTEPASELAAAVLDALPDATAVLDAAGTIITVNRAWRMFALDNGGSEASTGVGVNYVDVCNRSAEQGSDEARSVAADLLAVLSGESVDAEIEYACPSPSARRWFLLRINQLAGARGGAVVSHVNITRRKMIEEDFAHAASHDPLSGLPNRSLADERLTAALGTRGPRRRVPDVGVLYIDLDDFKSVNDQFGHAAGDEVLLGVAHRLRSMVRPGDTIGRLGGDEFVVIAPRIDDAGLTALTRRVTRALARPHAIHGDSLRVRGSVGAYLAAVGEQAADVLRNADLAMYRIKHRHRHRHRVT
jgi:diguanylate cyclase (GGDEF)-like protein